MTPQGGSYYFNRGKKIKKQRKVLTFVLRKGVSSGCSENMKARD